MYYYSNETTRKFLKSSKPRVYLYGSCTGYNNFGDIIQLKSTVLFHKRNTGLEPVIVMDLNSLTSSVHPQLLQSWYNTDYFIFLSSKAYDCSEAKLELITKVQSGGFLHVYGGGFLNQLWGKASVESIKSIIKQLHVNDYVFSGQQIDNTAITHLDSLFKIKSPKAFGLRDKQSLALMKKAFPGIEPKFSFDDVTEIFAEWIHYSHPTAKIWLKSKIQKPAILWHFNFSYYTVNDITAMLEKINLTIQKYPKYNTIIAVAYNDKSYGLVDSLRSLIEFDTSFPFASYQVVNIAQLALQMNPVENQYPNIMHSINNIAIAITSSYHTAMFANFLGIPAYLISTNDYYSQKQNGLGYKRSFTKFLNTPTINLPTYRKEMALRKEWLVMLQEVCNEHSTQTNKTKLTIIKSKSKNKPQKLSYRGYI